MDMTRLLLFCSDCNSQVQNTRARKRRNISCFQWIHHFVTLYKSSFVVAEMKRKRRKRIWRMTNSSKRKDKQSETWHWNTRGKYNGSTYVVHVWKEHSEIRKKSWNEISHQSWGGASNTIDTFCCEQQRLSFNFVLRTGTLDNGCHNADNDLVMKLQIRSANTGRLWTGAKADKSSNKWEQK